ncbi:MAG: hypothetical protein KGD63_07480 [Candidatus Lokiarchaeota archaeon]|nr:hypothetical protein [Candidatus Lokiarchaeota archaeon]
MNKDRETTQYFRAISCIYRATYLLNIFFILLSAIKSYDDINKPNKQTILTIKEQIKR